MDNHRMSEEGRWNLRMVKGTIKTVISWIDMSNDLVSDS